MWRPTTAGLIDQRTASGSRPLEPDHPAYRRFLEATLGVPLTDGNRVDVLRDGIETFPAILAAIADGERSIDMLWFSWGRGPVADRIGAALADRARHGVRVRILLDAFGSQRIARPLLADLRRAGCDVRFYRPLITWRPTTPNLRTHRRVLVCDETVAFTGGACIDESWTGNGRDPQRWRDTNVRVRGPAVNGIRSGFLAAWAQTRGGPQGAMTVDEHAYPEQPTAGSTSAQVLRPSSAPGWNDSALAVAALLSVARRRVRVATPYARLPGWLRDLVVATCRRGVQVQLLVSGPHVDRPAVHLQAENDYQPLLEAGVEIWRYQPARMHTKMVTVDGSLAMVGTTNFDLRSLDLNEQIALLLLDRAVTGVLDDHFDDDLCSSWQVSPSAWQSRGVARRVLETVSARVLLPLAGWGTTGLIGPRPR